MPFSQDQFRAIISGRRTDARASVARSLLSVASLGYRLAVCIRTALYEHHLFRAHRAEVPVLCVGNLTVGGTGKTPLVVWLAHRLDRKGLRVAILTRGYKTRKDLLSDEPAELASACPGVPVIVNADRVAGATEAVRNHGAQVLLMDDGFQHRRLARDLDIITIDATLPFGYGRLLPAGLLREPVSGLKRAHAAVITRSDQAPDEQLSQIEARIRRANPELPIGRTVHAPAGARRADGSEIALEELKGRKVFAFCGLGNPAAFFRTVEGCGCVLAGSQAFNDHHSYTDRCLAEIQGKARSCAAELLLTTSKDWDKITPLIPSQAPLPLAYLAVELRFTAAGDLLTALIDRALGCTMGGS